MEFISQFIDLNAIWALISSGFFLGGLVGAIVGTSVWTLFERGSRTGIPILVGAAIGLVFGMIWEGQGLSQNFGLGLESLLGSRSSARVAIVDRIILISAYVVGFMAVGAFIYNYRRATTGFLLGLILGTLSGVIFLLAADIINFPVQSSITPVLVGLLATIFLAFMALGDTGPSRSRRRR